MAPTLIILRMMLNRQNDESSVTVSGMSMRTAGSSTAGGKIEFASPAQNETKISTEAEEVWS
jgi:hypothetical protein